MESKFLSILIFCLYALILPFSGCKKDPQANPPILIAQPVAATPVKITDSVYPNPSVGNFTISTNSNTSQTAILYGMLGRQRFSLVINGTTAIVADSLPSGIYFLRITNFTDTITQKLVITH